MFIFGLDRDLNARDYIGATKKRKQNTSTMLATKILKLYPHVHLRRVEAATSKLLSGIRNQQYCHPIVTAVSCAARTFSSDSGTTTSDLVHTKLDLDSGIVEITMQNGSVNSLSLEM